MKTMAPSIALRWLTWRMRKSCGSPGNPLHTASFSAEYWDRVFEHSWRNMAGRTPIPTFCAKEVKFRAFLDYALTLGADFIATGHYAQTCRVRDNTWLVKGADPPKNKVISCMRFQTALNRTLFRLGRASNGSPPDRPPHRPGDP